MDVNPVSHNLHSLPLHPISTGISLYPEPSEHVNLASFLKFECVSGILVLPGYDPMPGGLNDRTSFPVLEAVVRCDTEVDALRVTEILYINAPDCSAELDSV